MATSKRERRFGRKLLILTAETDEVAAWVNGSDHRNRLPPAWQAGPLGYQYEYDEHGYTGRVRAPGGSIQV